MNLNPVCRARGSLLFLLPKEALSYPQSARQRHFIYCCCKSYWEQQNRAAGARPSYDELFPFDQLRQIIQDSFLTDSMIKRLLSFDDTVTSGWTDRLQSLRWMCMDVHPMAHLFGSPRSLERQVGQADLLFFLDCRQLYDDFCTSSCPNLSAFFQQTAVPDIEFVHQSASGHVLSSNNPFF